MGPSLRIELLGHFRLTSDGEPVAGVHSRQQALLTCLVLNRHRQLTRQQIASLLWPDSNNSQALTNLRREIHNLRRALPNAERYLSFEPGAVQWQNEASCSIDVCDLEAAIEQDDLEGLREATILYAGDLLPDCYDEWIAPERERLRAKFTTTLTHLTTILEERRVYSEAVSCAQRLSTLEPLDEDVYRTLMRLHALKGDRAAALHVYHTCASVLASELSIEPDAATRAAYERLLEDEAPAQQRSSPTDTPPLVGRHTEWELLLATWHATAHGRAQMLLIRGEAGIGKTRLAEALAEWCGRQGISLSRTRSYATEGRLAYAPVSEWLRSEALRPALSRLERPWLVEVARLLPELATDHPDLPVPEPMHDGWQRQRLFEALARAVLCASPPLLLVLDDLQWCDPDTLEWLHNLLRIHPESRLLVVGTLRTEEAADNPAVSEFLLNLRQLDRLVEIELGPLDAAETAALAAHVAEHDLDSQTAAHLYRQTEGLPLFIVEMAGAGLLGAPSRSPKVQAAISTRLSRLSKQAQELVHLAATVGRNFSFDVLSEASDLDEKSLVQALDELWQRRIVREQSIQRYDFSHDRVREVAYAEISPPMRRLLHKRVAQALELVRASDLDQVSAEVAAHHEQAGQTAKALPFYRRAADIAGRVFAVEEVIRHLSRALTAVRQLPESLERDKEELDILLALSAALGAARGYPSPEIEAALTRTKALGESLGEIVPIVHGLVGLSAVHLVRGENEQAQRYAEQALGLSEQLGIEHNTLRAACHWIAAVVPFFNADLTKARHHFDQCAALCDPDRLHLIVIGPDALIFSKAHNAHALWLAGYPDQAATHSHAAITRAEHIRHPMSLAIAHAYAALTHQFRSDHAATLEHARTAMDLCDRYGVVYYGEWGKILTGWCYSWERPGGESVSLIQQGLENLRKLNTPHRRGYYLSLQSQALVRAERVEEARAVLDAAIASAAQPGESWWRAELHRLKGELADAPEPWFLQALEIARSQAAKSLELRAATSLARLWKDRGDQASAHALLAPLYEWFTEGFDTPDLVDARTLLETL